MTRPRATYQYGDQAVSSPEGRLRFVVHDVGDGRHLALFAGGDLRWRQRVGWLSPKQLFVADDGCTAVLDARDVLTLRDPRGETVAEVPLLENVVDTLVSPCTAGRSWDEHLAGGFWRRGGALVFIIDGRGMPPLVFEPDRGARVEVEVPEVRAAQRARAVAVLAEARRALEEPAERGYPGWDPWRLAAVGWARLAGQTQARDAAPSLRALARLDLAIHGMTHMPLSGPPRDEVLVDRFGLDPLRQAAYLALLRMSEDAPAVATVQLVGRKRLLGTEPRTCARPPDWRENLLQVEVGMMPSRVVGLAGSPTHVESSDAGIVWSYDHRGPRGPASLAITWGRRGAGSVQLLDHIPEPTPRGRVG